MKTSDNNNQEDNFWSVIIEGLNQIELRHQECINSINEMGETSDVATVRELRSNLHFTRLQAKGLSQMAKSKLDKLNTKN